MNFQGKFLYPTSEQQTFRTFFKLFLEATSRKGLIMINIFIQHTKQQQDGHYTPLVITVISALISESWL